MHADFRRLSGTILTLLTACGIAALTGCGGDKAPTANKVALPEILIDSPAWAGISDADKDAIVATVDDIKIPAWRVKAALAKAPPGTNPEEILQSVIAEELIAREAAGGKGFVPERKAFERALATRYIEKKLVEDFSPEKVPISMLQEAFRNPQVWARFNHFDIYEVQDYQWICCPDPKNCDPVATEDCFKEGGAAMAAVSESIAKDKPEPGDLAILAPEYKKVAWRLSYQEYTFAFDKAAGYQRGASIVDDAVAEAVMKSSARQFSPPTRSRYGWHIAYLRNHIPDEHRDLKDSEVRKEIVKVFYQRFQQHEFLQTLAGLVPVDSLLLLKMYYENRPAPGVTPVFDLKIYRDALREAAESAAASKSDNVPVF
jgi:hypothetical protein